MDSYLVMAKRSSIKPFWAIIFLIVGLGLLLTAGCLQRQYRYETRGIPLPLPPPIQNSDPTIGLNVALFQYDDAELAQQLAQIESLGVSHIKQPFFFADDFDWEESDRIMTAVAQSTLTLVPLLDGNPDNNFAPPDVETFANWAGAFAQRYGEQVDAYIVWDEPNLTSHWGGEMVNPAAYGALLTAVATELRQSDPTALVVAAPLAPTSETGPQNLSETRFLRQLYEAGAADSFDVVAVKPYGFDTDATDRRVDEDVLNFSRPILVRELMVAQGDAHKPIWAGNWGWNSLPEGWNGRSSIWGSSSEAAQATQTVEAWQRARLEWPWMGIMFLENWQPDAPADDPVWGFSIAGREAAQAIKRALAEQPDAVAQPGFHFAAETGVGQTYQGGWQFSPEFGADISETPDNVPGDRVTFTFYGTDLGLRVRRADYRARLYVTIDGQPANALPRDENGTNLILTAPNSEMDELVTVPVATRLTPGIHTAEIIASRGWDQWALNGFAVGYRPAPPPFSSTLPLAGWVLVAIGLLLAWRTDWQQIGEPVSGWLSRLSHRTQFVLTAVTALIVTLSGWLTWGEQASGIYRRLGDSGQMALTAAAATLFYVTPTFYLYALALLLLFILIYLRPSWGLALVALCFPLYVPPLLKPIANYRFSPTEVFMLVTFGAVLLRMYTQRLQQIKTNGGSFFRKPKLLGVDWAVLFLTAVATLSLFFTDRLDVATNEWRVVIIEPVLFYVAMRLVKPGKNELWLILEAFLLGGLIVAGYGFFQYITGSDELITAEGGLRRIRSFYGSPNNVGLYLGRIIPILAALVLLGPRSLGVRRWLYAGLFMITAVVTLLTFSRGAIILGLPAALAYIFWRWQRENGRLAWPWLLSGGLIAALGLFFILQLPQFAGRFDLRGQTSFFRLALWQASWQMFLDHPWLGVGLDNFLYAYRGKYILNAAWQEPDLNHPHNIFLDFATRLGLLGLLAGGTLFYYLARYLRWGQRQLSGRWLALTVGMSGALIDIVMHGLVDHSFFLVDLAFVFMWMLGTAVSLQTLQNRTRHFEPDSRN